jgi:Putative MetA-pathway of phenol degradation
MKLPILPFAVLLCLPQLLHAEEGAGGQYIPGAYSSLLNITPNKPGFAVGDGFYFYTGDAGGGKTLPFGGLLASNVNANVYFNAISLAYTFCPTILGAPYTAAVAIPYVWADVEATVSINPRLFARFIGARTKTARDSANGVSDIAITPVAPLRPLLAVRCLLRPCRRHRCCCAAMENPGILAASACAFSPSASCSSQPARRQSTWVSAFASTLLNVG